MDDVDWLPPRAPGAQDPPRYAAREGEPVPAPAQRWKGPVRRRGVLSPAAAPARRATNAPPMPSTPGSDEAPSSVTRAGGPAPAATFTTGGAPKAKLTAPRRIALVAGIASVLFLGLTLGVAALPSVLVSALAGWIAQRERRRLGLAGLGVEGWIALLGLLAGCIAMVTWAILVANGFEPADLERELRELQRELERGDPPSR